MRNHQPPWLALALALTGLAIAGPAVATNGMYLVSYGAETAGRGGANLAVADRAMALNFNPAGLTQLQGNHYSLNLAVLAPSLEFENAVNGPTAAQDRYFPMPAFTWIRSGKETPWTFGLGLVGQGGMGATFDDLNTFFGTRDGTFSEVRFATLSPTVAYSVNEDFALGLTLNLGYADAAFRFFPKTSFFNTQQPEMSFFGLDEEGAGGEQLNARLGLWWRPLPRLSLGAIYQTETESNFDGGEMTVNFTAHPFLRQKVRYDAEIDGFTFAAQAGVGMAFRASDRWQLALDVKRYFWDHAISTITVTATEPNVAGAPPTVVVPFVFDWKDQWVYALGADYRASDRLTLRAGFNFGENPVPSDTLNPLFPATVEQHVTAGLSWLSSSGKVFELALEHAFNESQTNNNPNPLVNPFGPGARVDHSQWTLSFGLSWSKERH